MTTLEIHNVRSKIIGALEPKTLSALNSALSYELPGAFYARMANPWAGRRYFFSKASQTFPTGLIRKVEEILQKHKIEYDFVDARPQVVRGELLPIKGFTLRPYQDQTANRAVEAQRGIIKVGTGGGKTNILTGIISKTNVKTLVLIHKTDIFYQLIERLQSALNVPIGKIGDGECQIEKITVAMIQTVARAYGVGVDDKDAKIVKERGAAIRDFVETAECVLTDECHHVPSDSFWLVHQNAKNALYKLGFSASPWREDNADLLIEAAHARQVVDISASKLIEEGYLVPPVVYLVPFRHEKKKRTEKYAQIYVDEIVTNSARNEMISSLAIRAAKQGKSVLIAVTQIEHGQILERVLQSYDPDAIFVSGESDSSTRQKVLKELDQHKRKIVVCTTIFGEGIDCPGLDVLINAKAAASSVDAFQLIGRVLRQAPNKKKAYVVDIFDDQCKYVGAHSQARLDIYNTESRYEIRYCDASQVAFD